MLLPWKSSPKEVGIYSSYETNVDLNNRMVVFDIMDLKEKLRTMKTDCENKAGRREKGSIF